MFTARAAQAATAVAPGARVMVPISANPSVTLGITIAGGTARNVQFQAAFDRAGPWFNVGTARTTVGSFLETVPAVPFLRLNIASNTGSTVDAWVAR